jgi:16S rRNA (cytosine967-C5)-methyltransferase
MNGASPPLAEVLRHASASWQRFRSGQSLDRAIVAPDRLRPAVQDLTYAAVRSLALSEQIIAKLAARPPAPEVFALLAVALAQLVRERHAAYTVVDQAVEAARADARTASAASFVNALLRTFLRQRERLLPELKQDPAVRYNLPRWWLERMERDFPDWITIADAQLEPPPLVLRVNPKRIPVDDYLQRLTADGMQATQVGKQAVWLHQARPVGEIPGFGEGWVSVQDAAAQLAAPWLGVTGSQRVLDACAAPGGKTAHLAELGRLDLTALELDRTRTSRIEENLARIGANASLIIGDAARPRQWWDGRPFDRILLDAPCTASGIVRRHPDIPWLRRPADVAHLATLQAEMLRALWPLLGLGGRLLYVVCSLFPEEGREQIASFVAESPGAREVPLPAGSPSVQLVPTPLAAPPWDGRSTLPTLHDGFFYALLEKTR